MHYDSKCAANVARMYPSPATAAFQLHTGRDPPLLDDDDNDGYDGDDDDTPFSP